MSKPSSNSVPICQWRSLADEAERWLDKPVISVNVATYWHACRMNGIDDKLYGFTQLFARF